MTLEVNSLVRKRIRTITISTCQLIFNSILAGQHFHQSISQSINHSTIQTYWELTFWDNHLHHAGKNIFMRKVEGVQFLRFVHRIHVHYEATVMYTVNLFCSHHGFLAGSTPDPNRGYPTPAYNLVSRTSSAPSPSLQRRISTNTSTSFYLKNKGRRFNVQLKKGEENQQISGISTLSDNYSWPSPVFSL